MPNKFYACILLLFISCSSFVYSNEVNFDAVKVKVKQQTYALEYATTFEQRALGLMDRQFMCENCGMLFNFQQARMVSMWMKNTLIPLDVAFIQADGTILDIKAMQPLDLNTTSSSGKILYAWEMNQGWFKRNAISEGNKVLIVP